MAEPDVRQRNAAALLRSLRQRRTRPPAPSSPGRTGLAKATVGAIVGDLEQAGAVRAHEQVRSGDRGRPGLRLTLAGGRPVGIGFEANVEYVAAVVVDLSGAVRHRVTRPVADVRWRRAGAGRGSPRRSRRCCARTGRTPSAPRSPYRG